MYTFAVLLLCVQACLVQNVFSQCYGNYGPEVINNPGPGYSSPIAPATIPVGNACAGAAPANLDYAYSLRAPVHGYPGYGSTNAGYAGYGGSPAYSGAGEGNVAVAGEIPIGGNTAVIGQVPVFGSVSFGGSVPAAGAVSISGNCGCGCAGY